MSLNAQQSSHVQHPTTQEREFIPQTMQNFPVPNTTRCSYMQSQTPNISRTSTGPQNTSSLAHTVYTAQCFCYSSTLQNHPRGHYTPKPLSSVPHRFLQLVASCATSLAGPGGRQLPELSSPLICFGTWHQYHVKMHDPGSSSTKKEDASSYETEENWKRTEPSHWP